MSSHIPLGTLTLLLLFGIPALGQQPQATDLFVETVAPLLRKECVSCHNAEVQEGGLSLATRASLLAGSDNGPVVDLEHPTQSRLLEVVIATAGEAEMPLDSEPLTEAQVHVLREWLKSGAPWPADLELAEGPVTDTSWWSWQPIVRPAVPPLAAEARPWVRNPIDAFVMRRLQDKQLTPSPTADRATLMRRIYFDLLGLPPTAEELEAFVRDPAADAYDRLVERLLASPRYGERWGRHWLDVVHYGDTHGYDKDKPRPNAWPYRDYVIRSFNQDRSVTEFVVQQLAGDQLAPEDPAAIVATGFIAAGPWDFISQVEVPETKVDGQIARHLDRDDMVRATLESFCSVTVGCARCHHHKFDPITQEDYYRLQAVFAAVDRADRPYDQNRETLERRQHLQLELAQWQQKWDGLQVEIEQALGQSTEAIDAEISQLSQPQADQVQPAFGYHSQISATADEVKWVQVDLGRDVLLSRIRIVGCHDDFAGIGAGFGFPVRYRVEISSDSEFTTGVSTVVDLTAEDVANPGVVPQDTAIANLKARYIRVTATRLAPRQNDYIFALGELQALDEAGQVVSVGATVTSLDSIDAPVRWQRSNLVDDYWYGRWLTDEHQARLAELARQRDAIMTAMQASPLGERQRLLQRRREELDQQQADLPAPQMVYAAATDFAPQGNFKPTEGTPREIRVLLRGNVLMPDKRVSPGGIASLGSLNQVFAGLPEQEEGQARVALAAWISHPANPLLWRSMANRMWVYHFGRGLVDSPNDFGRMGQLPTHPELLDWLACELLDSGESLKHLHRLICTSATYQQASIDRPDAAAIDASNQFYWRMDRRRLEAEAIRDATLVAAGCLNLQMYGPGFQDFVIDKPEHSPHYEYDRFDPADPASHRRAVYRFIVRSQQQPFMTTLDCADPSMQVEKRNQTITPQQSLALMNNAFMLEMSQRFADDLRRQAEGLEQQVSLAYRRTLGRAPKPVELQVVSGYAHEHGLENTCRLLLNLNEFLFID